MPRRDGTGPIGAGAMTGRGLGPCNGANAIRYGAGLGMGFGLGLAYRRGFGRGFGRDFSNDYGRGFEVDSTSSRTKMELLNEQRSILQERLEAIDKELGSL